MDVPENAGRDITTTANSDHKIRLEYIEDLFRRGLTELVHLMQKRAWSVDMRILGERKEMAKSIGCQPK